MHASKEEKPEKISKYKVYVRFEKIKQVSLPTDLQKSVVEEKSLVDTTTCHMTWHNKDIEIELITWIRNVQSTL